MNRRLFLTVAALSISLVGMAPPSSATPITYNFSGTLTSTFGSLTAGDIFSGTYTLDPSVPAVGTSSYAVFNNLLDASLTIGSFSATVGPGVGLPEIQQDDVAGADRYALLGRNPTGSSQIGGLDISAFGFRLDDISGTVVSDATVLLTNLSLSDFTSNTFFVFFDDPGSPNFTVVTGTLSKLTVPEPSTLALLGVAAVAAAVSLSRGRTKALDL